MQTIPVCLTCRFWNGDLTCKAFPERIPDVIIDGNNDHSESVKGDHGLLYETEVSKWETEETK